MVGTLDTMTAGFSLFATRFGAVLRIFVLPWVITVCAVLALDLFWVHGAYRISPDWLNDLVFVVVLAPASVGLVRLALDDAWAAQQVTYVWDHIVVQAAVILGVWSLLDALLDWFPQRLAAEYGAWRLLHENGADAEAIYLAAHVLKLGLSALTVVLKAACQLVAVGLLVTVARAGWVNVGRLRVMIRTQGGRLFVLSLAVVIFGLALDWALGHVYNWLGLNTLWPMNIGHHWRPLALPMALSHVANFPWTLLSTIPLLMMTCGFRQIRLDVDRPQD